jgi:hypothetical protein
VGSLLAALGGSCVLIYHPGDYATGGGGHGGTASTTSGEAGHATTSTSGSTHTPSGTGGTGTGGSGADAGPPRVCEDLNAMPACLDRAQWTVWPCKSDNTAHGSARAVALPSIGNVVSVAVAGSFRGGITLLGSHGTAVGAGSVADETGFVAQIGLDGAGLALGVPNFPGRLRAVSAYRQAEVAALGRMAMTTGHDDGVLALLQANVDPSLSVYPMSEDGAQSEGHALVSDGTRLYAAGWFGAATAGSFHCGNAEGSSNVPHGSLMVTMVATDGSSLPTCTPHTYPGGGDSTVTASALALHGTKLVVAGTYQGSAPGIPGLTITSNATTTGFLAGINVTTMAAGWGLTIQNLIAAVPLQVESAVVAGDRLYVAGTFGGAIDFGGGVTLSSTGTTDGFLACYDLTPDSSANPASILWAVRLGGIASGKSQATGVAAIAGTPDAVYLTGVTEVAMSLPGTSATVCANGGIFVARLDGDAKGAETRWAQCFGRNGASADTVRIAVDDTHLVLAGGRTGFIQFGDSAASVEGGPAQIPFVAMFDRK